MDYDYDSKGRLIKQTYETGETVEYAYDNSGNLATVTDSATGITTTYYYDLLDRQVGYREKSATVDHSVTCMYNEDNQIASVTETVNGVATTYSYTYDEDNRVTAMTVGNITVSYTYDGFGRVSQKTVANGNNTIQTIPISYPWGTSTSAQVWGYDRSQITYDSNGNITGIGEDQDSHCAYLYDSQGQLIYEQSAPLGKIHTWTYDDAGNILSRAEYAVNDTNLQTPLDTVTYSYTDSEWGDLLTSYDGQNITYDAIGNPLSDGEWTYTWQNGRQLASMTKGSTTWTFTYDANGMRTSRQCSNNFDYEYVYSGDKLVSITADGYTYHFTYDANGTPLSISINDYIYYYVTNLQGDVVGILNEDGQQVATYIYDAWGKAEVISDDPVADYNPLLYRGYVYDWETGLYYLQSRYYDPEWGRFINPDAYAATGQGLLGNNMFAYCGNNPIMHADYRGENTEAVEWWTKTMWWLCLADAAAPVGDFIFVAGCLALGYHTWTSTNDTLSTISSITPESPITNLTSEDIDWNSGDKNHILKGSRLKNRGKSHTKGWRRLGIDPDSNDGWGMLLPLLKEVIDTARPVAERLKDGSFLVYYWKEYAEAGVTVVVKIWVSADGVISKISDAIPYT